MTVVVRRIGAVSQTGVTSLGVYESLLFGGSLPSPLVLADEQPRMAHATSKPYPQKLYHLALSAAERAAVGTTGPIDHVFVGSSSDSNSAREHGWTEAEQVPSLARKLAYEVEAPKFSQFGSACSASSQAIIMACDMFEAGYADRILVGGADEVTASSVDGFAACRIYSDRCRPFSKDRKGLVLGDGAAFLMLECSDERDGIAQIIGTGVAADGYHMVSMDQRAVFDVIDQAMREAGANSVDFIIAHGTGTPANDAVESDAISRYFGRSVPSVVSYKGGFGHVQGASGAMGVVLAIEAMRHRTLFPSIGAEPVDEDLAISDRVSTVEVYLPVTRPVRALVLSHGTWGSYTAILVEVP